VRPNTAFGALKKGILAFVPTILTRAISMGLTINDRGMRLGGWFCLLRFNDHQMEWTTTVCKFGDLPSDSRSLEFCQEKATRVLKSGSSSSWLTRDPEKNQWGGAVRVHEDVVLSFSGLPEDADEALVLVLAVYLDLIDLNDAQKIADQSGNEKFIQLFQEVNRLLS
jgi:hypothetical protein